MTQVPARNDHAPAHLVLADGRVFAGTAIGASGASVGEVVFTTGMTGYQEVLTDPSYCGQIVTMTAPQMGNTGVNEGDLEHARPRVAGFVVHELSPLASNWRCNATLDAYLKKQGVVAIAGVDTRTLTRHIRDNGAQMAAIGTGSVDDLLARAKAAPDMNGLDLTLDVTTDKTYAWTQGAGVWGAGEKNPRWHVVAVDFGIKHNILR